MTKNNSKTWKDIEDGLENQEKVAWMTCAECKHEICKFCKQCHNQDCDEFCYAVKPCYAQLLNK